MNPVLSQYEKSDGFAYQEGRAAYAKASGTAPTAVPTATAAPAPAAPPAGTPTDFDYVTAAGGARLTINDVVVKTAMLFVVTVIFAVIGWNTVAAMPWVLWVGMIGGLVLGLVNAFKRVPSPGLILLYGVFEGLFLGGISQWYNEFAMGSGYEGIVLQAVVATMTTFGVMLALYLTGIIKVNKKFVSIMIVAAVSYMLLGIASLVAALFGVGDGWGFYGITGLGLIICVVGVLIAAFFLLLDFEAIAQGIRMGAPERESWRMAFGLTVTLVWLYLEFLRLLAVFTRN